MMKTLSDGSPSTLATYRAIAVALCGEGSKAVEFLDGKIAASPNGANEMVFADETQMLHLIMSMANED